MARATFDTTGMNAGAKTRLQDCLLLLLANGTTITQASHITDAVIADYLDSHLTNDVIKLRERSEYQNDYSFSVPDFS